MDFNKYAQRMTQKYQVAVAIAVIRNKPDNLSSGQYISQLKDKIESDQGNKKFIPLTNDFNFDDNDFNFDDNDDSLNINEFNENYNERDALNIQTSDKIYDGVNLQQDFNITTKEVPGDKERAANNNEITILSEVSPNRTNSLGDILRTLKDIDDNKGLPQSNDINSIQNYSQVLPSNSLMNFSQDPYDENMTICDDSPKNNIDFINLVAKSNTQVTIDERVKANVAKNYNKSTKINEPDKINEAPSTTGHGELEENVFFKNTYDMEVDMALNDILEPEPGEQFDESNIKFIIEKAKIVSKNIAKELNKRNCSVNQTDDRNNKPNIIGNINKNQIITAINSTQDTILYTVDSFTQNTAHISQSQYQNIEIPKAYIYGNKDKHILPDEDNNTQKINNNETVIDKDDFNKDKNIIQNPNIPTVDSSEIQYIIDKSGNTYAILNSIQFGKELICEENTNKNTETSLEVHNKTSTLREEIGNSLIIDAQGTTQENIETPSQPNTELLDIDEYLDKETDDSEQVVPFKVVKELTRIKAFLSKREQSCSTDGFSFDSGYRSDSQKSFKTVSARLSDDWLQQSATCLYNYIVQCPLVAVTQEIVHEISQVLGRLVDHLHEAEKYPTFLEQLLDKVDSLLRELTQHSGSYENILLEKDETIQRLLLLNKSNHIIKFSLDKIANIFEKVHSNLTSKENLYELVNISEIENLRYIFYILEILIQMYVKVKDPSQLTQNSQETNVLKKSSITEIWRKKWNPDSKEPKNVGSQDKTCVLTKCGEILNKIIVDCMEGYGLVSFAALQCFNMLQK